MNTGLDGKVVIVTGGGSGIGRATAFAFAEEGARIAVLDWKNPEDVMGQIDHRLIVPGGATDAIFCLANVADATSVEAAVKTVMDRWEHIDILVNNAGITRDAILVKMTEEAFDAVIAVNLKGSFNCAKAVVPSMIANGGGVILNASSIVAANGNFGQTNYVATKCAVEGVTKVWARELGKHHIRVNAVAPGFITTDMTSKMKPESLDAFKARTPLGRLGTPEDIARAYVWLASDYASFITGAVIPVSGGLVIGT
jgi:3-oxoacyl-[acyl-carrier protein] reductase